MSQPIELEVRKLAGSGQGVAYAPDGGVYFAAGAVPGDRIACPSESLPEKYEELQEFTVVEPSRNRVAPECPAFGQCGGCDWQHLEITAQHLAKEQIVLHQLSRAGVVPLHIEPFAPSEKNLHYRNRLQVHAQGGKIGFFRKRSRDLVPIEKCYLADPRLNQELEKLAEKVGGDPKLATHFELQLTETGEVQVLEGMPYSVSGFRQVNPYQNAFLVEKLAAWVGESGARRVLELYCGDGNLTGSYIGMVDAIYGIDSNPAAVRRAQARLWEKEAVFDCKLVQPYLGRKLQQDFHYDTLILDPPRDGVGNVLSCFVGPEVGSVIYVSCSPQSFARDAQCLVKANYRLERLQCIDMFPQTRHVEILSWWRRFASSVSSALV